MRCGVTKSIPWVSEGAGRLCGHSVGYPLARTAHHETMAVLAAAHPTYVIAAIHRRCTLSCPCLPMLGRCSTPPHIYLETLLGTDSHGVLAIGGVQGVAPSRCGYVNSTHNKLSLVTVLIVLLHGQGFMRCSLSE